jgi:LysM repeat protein
MKSNQKLESKTRSKIFTKSTVNQKKTSKTPTPNTKPGTSLLKKNEFALILMGALLLTIIIFFFFFRSSDSKPEIVKQNLSQTSFLDLEKRIQNIEKALQIDKNPNSKVIKTKQNKTQDHQTNDRLSRLETAFSVKFDSLIDRMGKIEKNIAQFKTKPVKKIITKKVEPKAVIPVKKPVKKKSMFHTVQKKETLYSISKKYNTTIEKLRTLNKLSKNAKLFPGDNLLIR